jgi:hypothetical protein
VSKWRPIAKAPRDGTEVTAAAESRWHTNRFPYPVTSRFLDGKWCAEFGIEEWKPYEPQPTHFLDHSTPSHPVSQ